MELTTGKLTILLVTHCLDLEKLLGRQDPQTLFELPQPKDKTLPDDDLNQFVRDGNKNYFDRNDAAAVFNFEKAW